MSSKAEQFGRIVSKIELLEAAVNGMARKLSEGDASHGKERRQRDSSDGHASQKRRKTAYWGLDSSGVYQEDVLGSGKLGPVDMLASASVGNGDSEGGDSNKGCDAGPDSAVTELFTSPFAVPEDPLLARDSQSGVGMACTNLILTPKGLEWLKSKCLNSDFDLQCLTQCYHAAFQQKDAHICKIPTAPRELPEASILERLLDIYALSGAPVLSVISAQCTIEIYAKYKFGGVAAMKATEVMVLNIVFALACLIIKLGVVEEGTISLLALNVSPQELQEYENIFIANALRYTHRTTVVPEGLLSVKAILCLITYTSFSGALHASYILVAIAARLAQDMGLHADIMLEDLTPEEQYNRRSIWWLCRFFDLRLAITLGKPPVIASFDTNTKIPAMNNKIELLESVIYGSSEGVGDYDIDFTRQLYKMVLQSEGFIAIARHYIYKLCLITSQMYEQICASSAKMEPKTQLKIATKLIAQLEKYRLSLPENMRPGTKEDDLDAIIANQNLSQNSLFWLVYEIQLSFLIDMMMVHRSQYKAQTRLYKQGKIDVEPEYKCVEYARDILLCIVRVKLDYVSIIMRSKPWAFLLAFFDIYVYSMVHHTNAKIIEKDMQLLIKAYNSLAQGLTPNSNIENEYQMGPSYRDKNSLTQIKNVLLIFKCLLNILRSTLEAKLCIKFNLPGVEQVLQYTELDQNFFQTPIVDNVILNSDIMLNPFATGIGFEETAEGYCGFFR
ncbi:AGL348Wp [Eremothecium gossypii ATCC 10895]|uniref:AGL348Wp n=1 Tax=Eremothecium gossypii (strain ATCC 10895 / CBS 109.51 / FGSC 9923 / NRRL Y-1056) TaxID=284811 RepID=Q751N8_EREGS|nr:AGL348Wp [Eremothecium gossypii ATCC 10895]AAS54143.1 AGL348Wp [Eremothecium gossypii ATCC 10895]AEY98469.1 FAGL348Wp [Eremothecium gossypii FDAG1]